MQVNKYFMAHNFVLVFYKLFIFIFRRIILNIFNINHNFLKINNSLVEYSKSVIKWDILQYSFYNNFIDGLQIYFLLIYYKLKNDSVSFKKVSLRLEQSHIGVYISNNFAETTFMNNRLLFAGFQYFWKTLRFWIIGLILSYFFCYFLMYVRSLAFAKMLFIWLILVMFAYWLLSGFVFFIKKYQFGKFTSSMQRFWRRSLAYFWLLELFLFGIYCYLTINAFQEPVFMYDQIQIFKSHLFSWRLFILKLVPIAILVIFTYICMLSMKWTSFSKSSLLFFFITLLLLYLTWLEFYQFFHVMNFYGNLSWSFDQEENVWLLEVEQRRTRTVNSYVILCITAKFWHLIFILGFWLFFILRINELQRARYPLFSANHQNFLILYILSWISMFPWLKFILRRFMDNPYYWFFTSARSFGLRVFFNDIYLIYFGLIEHIFSIFRNNVNTFCEYSFIYWVDSTNITGLYQYKHHFIRDAFLNLINRRELKDLTIFKNSTFNIFNF